jgi:transcriptional regulator with XRE-family HTH domain
VDVVHTVGARVERLRRLAGLTREQLATLSDVSASTIKFVENGRRGLTLRVAQRIAPYLHIRDLTELFGESMKITFGDRPTHEAIPEVRKALTSWPIEVSGEPSSPAYLRGLLDSAWQTWHTSERQHSETGRLVPGLLLEAQRSVRLLQGTEKREALSVLAQAYHVAQAYLAWHGDRELCWLTVDRGMTAAMDADDPLAIASSIWYAAHLLRAGGRADEALDQLRVARGLVEPRVAEGATEYAAMLADIHLNAALTKARSGDQGAWADWESANEVIRRALPPGYVHPWTRVGSVLADVYSVMIAVDLGQTDDAQRRAATLDPATIPSTDRRARHHIELARAADMSGSPEATLHLLTKGHAISAETVEFSPAARDMAARLVTAGPATTRRDAEQLAESIGVHA